MVGSKLQHCPAGDPHLILNLLPTAGQVWDGLLGLFGFSLGCTKRCQRISLALGTVEVIWFILDQSKPQDSAVKN